MAAGFSLKEENIAPLRKALNENTVRLSSVRPREEWEMPREDLLGAEYAPGDEGQE